MATAISTWFSAPEELRLRVYLNSGDGTLQAGVSYDVGNGSDAIAVADWNGDGIPDIAVATGRTNTVSVLLGKGDGTFTRALDYLGGSGAVGAAAGDLNGDGKPDLVVADEGRVSILLNTNKR